MKGYTDLDQSRKLAEFLPIKSADMGWNAFVDNTTRILPIDDWDLSKNSGGNLKFYPAWSLAALLGILPEGTNISTPNPLNELSYCCWNQYNEIYASNPTDACYEMVLKLHELNLL
jgi:hypothetical protein